MPDNLETGIKENLVPFDEVEKMIKAFHADHWGKWFRFIPYHAPEVFAYTNAEIEDQDSQRTAAYMKKSERIEIHIPKEGLPFEDVYEYSDHSRAARFELQGTVNGLGRYAWSDWQITLTEEICHEFQWRAIENRADGYGLYLYQGYGQLDDVRSGHTEGFSTAVGQFAATFSLDVHRLIRTLKTLKSNRPAPPNDPWLQYLDMRQIAPSDVAIAAYLRYRDRNSTEGADQEDWYRAEQELKAIRDLR